MKFSFDIKSNAIDSFNESLAKYEQGQAGDIKSFKFAITHLAHSIELVLKIYLQTLDEFLVFSKCFKEVEKKAKSDGVDLLSAFSKLKAERFDFEKIVQGIPCPHTVNVEQALSVAMCEVCKITSNNFLDQEFIDDINWMKDLRNSIEHYEFDFTPKEVRLCIGRLIRGLADFADLFSLFDLESEVGKDRFHVFEVLADEYSHFLAEANITVAEAKRELFSGVRPKHQVFIEWNVYDCPSCGNSTMIPNRDSSTGYRCTFNGCGNEESEEIEVDCDICGGAWQNGDMTSWEDTYTHVCPRCENPEAW